MKVPTFRRCFINAPIAAVVVSIIVTGCQTTSVQQIAVKADLPPAQPPIYEIGKKTVWRMKDGSEITYETTDIEDTTITGRGSDGCIYSFRKDGFGRATRWENCSGSTGTHRLSRSGNMYPLQVGNTESWKYTGKNTKGDSWSGMRECEVKGTAHVTVPAGSFDTYHVVCEEKGWKRYEWHYSPKLRRTVTSIQAPMAGSSAKPRHLELVRIIPAPQ